MDHNHGPGKCNCHEEMKDLDPFGEDLFPYIDIPSVAAFGEESADSVWNVFRVRDEMLVFPQTSLKSDEDDPQLVIRIPFTTDVKVKSLTIIGGDEGSAPKTIHLYVNRDNIDFSILEEFEPTQTIEAIENPNGEFDYPLKITKFSNVACLGIGIEDNHGAGQTEIKYIGFKGENNKTRAKPVIAVYESWANLADHKTDIKDQIGKDIQ